MKIKIFLLVTYSFLFTSILISNTKITAYKPTTNTENIVPFFIFEESNIKLSPDMKITSIKKDVAENIISTGYKKIAPIVYDSNRNQISGIKISFAKFVVLNEILYAPEDAIDIYGIKGNPDRWNKFYNILRLEENSNGTYSIIVDRIVNTYYVEIKYPDNMKEAAIFNKHLTGIIDSESDIENTIDIYWDSEINKHYFELWTKISGTIQINQIEDFDILIKPDFMEQYKAKSKDKLAHPDHIYTVESEDILRKYKLHTDIDYEGSEDEKKSLQILMDQGFVLNNKKEKGILYKGNIDNDGKIYIDIPNYLSDIIEYPEEQEDFDIHSNTYQEEFVIKFMNDNKNNLITLPTLIDEGKIVDEFTFKSNYIVFNGNDYNISLGTKLEINHYEDEFIDDKNIDVITLTRSESMFEIDITTSKETPPLEHLYLKVTNKSKSIIDKRISLIYNYETDKYEFKFQTLEPFNIKLMDGYNRFKKKVVEVEFKNPSSSKVGKCELTIKDEFTLALFTSDLSALNLFENKKMTLKPRTSKKDDVLSQIRRDRDLTEDHMIFHKMKWNDAPYTLEYNDSNPYIENLSDFEISIEDFNKCISIDDDNFFKDQLVMYEFKEKIRIKVIDRNHGKPLGNIQVTLNETAVDNYTLDKNLKRIKITNENGNVFFNNVIDYKNAEISFEDRHGKTVNKKLSDLNINPSGSYEIKN